MSIADKLKEIESAVTLTELADTHNTDVMQNKVLQDAFRKRKEEIYAEDTRSREIKSTSNVSMERTMPSSFLSIFDTTKDERKSFVKVLKEEIEQGTANPLDIHYKLKCIAEISKALTDDQDYKRWLLAEAAKHGSKAFSFRNAQIETVEVGTTYDYTGDPVWVVMAAKMEKMDKEIKHREALLKTLQKPMVETNVETGEVFEVFPPIKKSTTSVKVTLK